MTTLSTIETVLGVYTITDDTPNNKLIVSGPSSAEFSYNGVSVEKVGVYQIAANYINSYVIGLTLNEIKISTDSIANSNNSIAASNQDIASSNSIISKEIGAFRRRASDPKLGIVSNDNGGIPPKLNRAIIVNALNQSGQLKPVIDEIENPSQIPGISF